VAPMESAQSQSADPAVTIVGGGPVGLSLALGLARQGIESRLLDLKPTTTDHPKSRGCWLRTMEIFRQWGIEEGLRPRGLPDGADCFAVVDGIANPEFGRSKPEPIDQASPSRKCGVAQDAVEDELLKALRAQGGCDVRFATEFVDAAIDDDGVVVRARDLGSGEVASWRSRFLLGADGGSGAAASVAGIRYEGPPVMALMLNTYFRADLSGFQVAREAGALLLRPPGGEGQVRTILNTDGRDRWLFLTQIGVEHDERLRPWTEAETIEAIRDHLALPDLEVSIINESVWRRTRRIAERYRNGRVLLVGDAAHRFPPTGGMGMNSGIQDAHNLAWKIAFVLRGDASEALLDSYDAERRAAAHSNADISLHNTNRLEMLYTAILAGNPDQIRFWLRDLEYHTHNTGQSLGWTYGEGAFIPDAGTRPAHDPRYYRPVVFPGARFPHFWLDDAKTRSSLDLFERRMTLVIGHEADSWSAAAADVARRRGLPIEVFRLPPTVPPELAELTPRGAALVRPDGVTAWRIGWQSGREAEDLGAALDELLHPKGEAHAQRAA
jgi:2-polyprenyl-6-methoxyphenol hydroxylase-like FAD-dependent oxidoreductase